MKNRTHFAHRVDAWDDEGSNVIEQNGREECPKGNSKDGKMLHRGSPFRQRHSNSFWLNSKESCRKIGSPIRQ
jgi:hypothetical protein